jgi:hypothetical protein
MDVEARDPGSSRDPDVARLVDHLVRAAGDSVWGVLFFGSRLVGTSPGPHSAADLFVIVRDYGEFYRRFVPSSSASARHPRTLARLNRFLPPNILSLKPDPDAAGAKLFVIDRGGFARATGPRAKDHFCRGRLSQTVAVVWTASDEARRELETRVHDARRSTVDWAVLECPPSFDVLTYCERMLARSYRAEIRPESASRVREVFSAQREFWARTYPPILDASPDLAARGDRWQLVRRPSRARQLRWSWYFRVSRARATLRWSKYVLTFEGWLDYIVRKVELRTGQTIELTPLDRRWPLLTLWPTAWRVLRNARRASSGEARRK